MSVRKPAVAGTFYPGNPAELSKMIAGFMAQAPKKSLAGHPLALVAPHAGYAYSGRTAAFAYRHLVGISYDAVVVISPSHTVFFQGASVFDGEAYETPLGEMKVDHELVARVTDIHPSVFLSNKGHTGGSVRGEHSLEVQLPFLQHVLGDFKLVPIVMGDQEEPTCRALGEVLASALSDKNALIVASTDLSHFHSDEEARRLDENVRRAIEEFDPGKLLNVLAGGRGEACGGGPVAATLLASKRLGGEQVEIIDYSTSGETTGDLSEVVGYLSAIVVGKKRASSKKELTGSRLARERHELNKKEKEYLKELVVRSIASKLRNERLPEDVPDSRLLRENRGAFVTLKIRGLLRGCIGQIRAASPLYQTVKEMALAAAFEDPRFSPLQPSELDYIGVEVSVLSPLVRVHDLDEIEVGRDGLMIRLDFHSGLLLPQVATEHEWDKVTFLEQTCLKAGLPKSSYKDKAAEIYRFSADVF